MILLTKNSAKERCRTCLCKLLKDEQKSYEVENVKFQTNFADINANKELQEMLEKYVCLQWKEDFYKDQLYPKYVCMECLQQLQTFETFRNKAMDSAKKLYRVFSGTCDVLKVELHDEGQESKNDTQERSSYYAKENIFNLLLKDSLMETEAIILGETDVNNETSNMDPDPFQSTQKQGKVRTRRAKIKRSLRKSKFRNFTENESVISKLETTLQNKHKIEQTECEGFDEALHWQGNTIQDPDDSSSDNEVLSKKMIHSQREVNKTRDDNLKDNCTFSNNDYIHESVDYKENLKEKKRPSRIRKKNNEFEKYSLEIIKTELSSQGDVSSDSDFNDNTNIFQKAIKVEKKKRHYILNSGRKKGLANRYKCDQCQHKFGHKLTLEAHVRKVHEGQKKAFKCQLCDKAYSFIGGLSTHIRDVHERKQDSYDCTVPGCEKKYSNFITLQRHVRFKHLNMETPHQYVCEQCGSTFKQSSNLRYHMKTRHPTEEDLKRKELLPKDRLECEECKKSFHSQYTLKYHKLRVHADEKKFECKICGRRVAKQFMLDSHMLVHSDQKMACKFCGREFVRKYQVEAHIRAVHQKLKPFQCSHCSESFASRKTLRHHIYIHTGEKPYVCDICGQSYRQPTCLKNHRKIHNKHSANNAATANRTLTSNFVLNSNTELENEKNILLK